MKILVDVVYARELIRKNAGEEMIDILQVTLQ